MSLVQPTSGRDAEALARATFSALQDAEDIHNDVRAFERTWDEEREEFSAGELAALLDFWDQALVALEAGLELAKGLLDREFVLSCAPAWGQAGGLAAAEKLQATTIIQEKMAFAAAVTWAYERHGARAMRKAVKRQADGKKA